MLNSITIHGYLGRAPELREYTNARGEQGQLVNLSVGVSRFGDGTDWFDVTMFGKRALTIEKYFSKGSQIVVRGRMQADTVEKDGKRHKYWKLIAEDFDFCDSKSGTVSSGSSGSEPDRGPQTFEEMEEDIPF